jgi:sugar phosphate isomerase/epimerase
MIEAFAALCREGAEHGTRIGWELMPFCDIDSVEKAVELVKGAGEPNGGICLDLWHIAKLKIPYEKVARMPRKYITSIEVNDGTHECPWPLHEDTINHRLFCGEGEFDPKRFVSLMLKAGYDGPWGIEVLNQEARSWPIDKLARHAFQTTIAQFPGHVTHERARQKPAARPKKARRAAKGKARKSPKSRATRRATAARKRRR